MYSCQKKVEVNPHIEEEIFLNETEMQGMTKLGKQLENPYSVSNMKKALESLKLSNSNRRISGENVEITRTHLYIRFKPKNEEELAILKSDSTLVLYDYPLDYEIEETGSFYHDPEVPINQPTYQYCAVKVNQILPQGVDYELLAELFIPDEDSDETNISVRSASNDWTGALADTLVNEALRITGNLHEEDENNTSVRRRRKWRPAGTIRVWDDNLSNWVGVEGVEVRARRWFTTHRGIANSSGYYSCNGRFRRNANYSIVWERHNFEIRKSWLGRAKYGGPKKRGNWDLNIKGGGQEFYATIFRAAHHYYYKNIKGLRRPPQNRFWKTQLKIRAYNKSNNDTNGSHCASCRFLGIGSPVKIYNPQRDSEDIYGTVIHELAHASHWSMDRYSYRNCSAIVAESWARGVQWELTRMVYTGYRGGRTIPPSYTQVVVDMIDPNYSSENANLNNGLWNDNVTGYTIRQLEDALKGQRNWNDWKDNIENKYNNGTKNNLEALFNHWANQ